VLGPEGRNHRIWRPRGIRTSAAAKCQQFDPPRPLAGWGPACIRGNASIEERGLAQ
jgi:hypothetical protein